jgi:hypothetical protein
MGYMVRSISKEKDISTVENWLVVVRGQRW